MSQYGVSLQELYEQSSAGEVKQSETINGAAVLAPVDVDDA
jgi:hypothetical protein